MGGKPVNLCPDTPLLLIVQGAGNSEHKENLLYNRINAGKAARLVLCSFSSEEPQNTWDGPGIAGATPISLPLLSLPSQVLNSPPQHSFGGGGLYSDLKTKARNQTEMVQRNLKTMN